MVLFYEKYWLYAESPAFASEFFANLATLKVLGFAMLNVIFVM